MGDKLYFMSTMCGRILCLPPFFEGVPAINIQTLCSPKTWGVHGLPGFRPRVRTLPNSPESRQEGFGLLCFWSSATPLSGKGVQQRKGSSNKNPLPGSMLVFGGRYTKNGTHTSFRLVCGQESIRAPIEGIRKGARHPCGI